MKLWITFFIISFLAIPCGAWSISIAVKQKYPYQILTDDYGILNENDLAGYVWKMNPAPFKGKFSGLNYWQCFPRENISLVLLDTGSSTEDFNYKDNIGDMQIRVWVKKNVSHEYAMRRAWTVGEFQKDFNRWRKLMKGEKYVCLGGHFVDYEKTKDHGVAVETYGWIFDKIKTKKGCYSYFDGDCDRKYDRSV